MEDIKSQSSSFRQCKSGNTKLRLVHSFKVLSYLWDQLELRLKDEDWAGSLNILEGMFACRYCFSFRLVQVHICLKIAEISLKCMGDISKARYYLNSAEVPLAKDEDDGEFRNLKCRFYYLHFLCNEKSHTPGSSRSYFFSQCKLLESAINYSKLDPTSYPWYCYFALKFIHVIRSIRLVCPSMLSRDQMDLNVLEYDRFLNDESLIGCFNVLILKFSLGHFFAGYYSEKARRLLDDAEKRWNELLSHKKGLKNPQVSTSKEFQWHSNIGEETLAVLGEYTNLVRFASMICDGSITRAVVLIRGACRDSYYNRVNEGTFFNKAADQLDGERLEVLEFPKNHTELYHFILQLFLCTCNRLGGCHKNFVSVESYKQSASPTDGPLNSISNNSICVSALKSKWIDLCGSTLNAEVIGAASQRLLILENEFCISLLKNDILCLFCALDAIRDHIDSFGTVDGMRTLDASTAGSKVLCEMEVDSTRHRDGEFEVNLNCDSPVVWNIYMCIYLGQTCHNFGLLNRATKYFDRAFELCDFEGGLKSFAMAHSCLALLDFKPRTDAIQESLKGKISEWNSVSNSANLFLSLLWNLIDARYSLKCDLAASKRVSGSIINIAKQMKNSFFSIWGVFIFCRSGNSQQSFQWTFKLLVQSVRELLCEDSNLYGKICSYLFRHRHKYGAAIIDSREFLRIMNSVEKKISERKNLLKNVLAPGGPNTLLCLANS